MIKLLLTGHLGNDATVNNVNGKTVINLSVAHTEAYKDANGVKVNKTLWVSVAYWSEKTNIVPYLKKGTLVYVEGTPEVDTYMKENKVLPQLRLRAMTIQLLGSNNNQSNQNQPTQSTPQNSSMDNFNKHLGSHTTDFEQSNDIAEPIDGLPF